MTVTDLSKPHTEWQGQNYYFCSEKCLQKFIATPEAYVKAERSDSVVKASGCCGSTSKVVEKKHPVVRPNRKQNQTAKPVAVHPSRKQKLPKVVAVVEESMNIVLHLDQLSLLTLSVACQLTQIQS
jgi:Cu+-exporting ATPase